MSRIGQFKRASLARKDPIALPSQQKLRMADPLSTTGHN